MGLGVKVKLVIDAELRDLDFGVSARSFRLTNARFGPHGERCYGGWYAAAEIIDIYRRLGRASGVDGVLAAARVHAKSVVVEACRIPQRDRRRLWEQRFWLHAIVEEGPFASSTHMECTIPFHNLSSALSSCNSHGVFRRPSGMPSCRSREPLEGYG